MSDQDLSWRITWRGVTFTDADMIGADLCAAQLMLGADGWAAVDPTRGPIQLSATICVAVHRLTGRPLEELQAEVGAAPLGELLGALWVFEKPKAA